MNRYLSLVSILRVLDNSLGEWLIGFQRCLGSIRYPNGDIYRGQLEQGEPFGYGSFTSKNGDVYEGEWRAGLKHGFGRYVSQSRVKAWDSAAKLQPQEFRIRHIVGFNGTYPRKQYVSNDRYARWEDGVRVQDFITLQMIPPTALLYGRAGPHYYQEYANGIRRTPAAMLPMVTEKTNEIENLSRRLHNTRRGVTRHDGNGKLIIEPWDLI